jgi:hypothetical protein
MSAPIRSSEFVGSIGVAAHLSLYGTPARAAQAVSAVQYLGISGMRTTFSAALVQPGGVADKLAAAGVRFDVLMGGAGALADSVGFAATFAKAHPHSLAALEGPNEINNWPITFNGLSGVKAGIAFTDALAGMARSNPWLAGADIYDFTGASRTAATSADAAGFTNIHPYPQRGAQPYDWLEHVVQAAAVPGKGLVITEAGYTTTTGQAALEGVDPTVQAKLTLNLLADARLLGVAKTYLYQLSGTTAAGSIDSGFGLFDAQLRAKPVATAIHNLTTILADPAADAGSFTPHALDYAISGLPEGAHSLLIEKAGGTYELMIWAEPDIWNEAADAAIAAPASTVTVMLSGSARLSVYDPLVSASAVAAAEGNTISLAVSDHVMVVEIAGLPAGAAVQPAKYDLPILLSATANADHLTGGGNDDVMSGMSGNDVLLGGGGDDRLTGGMGTDDLTGGSGADTFVFQTAQQSTVTQRDTIRDFGVAEGDRIDLARIDANAKLGGDQAFALGGPAFTKVAGQLIQADSAEGLVVSGDLNGDGKADFALLLAGLHAPLGAEAFIL